MALRTRSLVSLLIDGLFLQVLETVDGDTPARAATSLMVTAINCLLTDMPDQSGSMPLIRLFLSQSDRDIVVHNKDTVKHIARKIA
ncbi:hypothetical protein HMPREF1547_01942 [Blautia sp. KLE 1732]|nr:hypothetical protein HMPREF1547_01942 [Blautia sp. KLE 1732]